VGEAGPAWHRRLRLVLWIDSSSPFWTFGQNDSLLDIHSARAGRCGCLVRLHCGGGGFRLHSLRRDLFLDVSWISLDVPR
jgi:hypothetical protein